MSLNDIATIVVSTTGAGVTRAGFGVPLIVSHTAGWSERTRTYSSIAAVGGDFAANSPEYLAAQKAFGQSPGIQSLVIGRASLQPTEQIQLGVIAAGLNTNNQVRIATPTGVVFPSQVAAYNPGAGAIGWVGSGVWSANDIIVGGSGSSGPNLYSCLGKSGPSGLLNPFGGFTGIGGTVQPSGLGAAIADGQVYWAWVGSGVTGGVTPDCVAIGVKAAIDALAQPVVVGTGLNQLSSQLIGAALSRGVQLTANAPASFFAAEVINRAQLSAIQSYADPGIATDLTAINNENAAWYGLVTLFNSSALVLAAAAWVEANTKLYAADSLDTQIATVAETPAATDLAHVMKGDSFARSWCFFHPANDDFAAAAELGRFFPIDPGGETWRMKSLAGVSAKNYTATEIANLKAKNASWYYGIGAANTNSTTPVIGGNAVDAAGEYIDVVRFIDWFTANLQGDLADMVIQAMKIPFTNPGIDAVESKVRARIDAGIAAGGIAANPVPVVTAPDVSDVTSADKTARNLEGVNAQFTLAGAIHHITVNVTANS